MSESTPARKAPSSRGNPLPGKRSQRLARSGGLVKSSIACCARLQACVGPVLPCWCCARAQAGAAPRARRPIQCSAQAGHHACQVAACWVCFCYQLKSFLRLPSKAKRPIRLKPPQYAKTHQPRATPCPASDGRAWRVLAPPFWPWTAHDSKKLRPRLPAAPASRYTRAQAERPGA